MVRLRSECNLLQPAGACLSLTASSPSPSSDTKLSVEPWATTSAFAKPVDSIFRRNAADAGGAAPAASTSQKTSRPPNLELQLLTKASSSLDISGNSTKLDSTQLQLSIGSSEMEMDNANIAAGSRYSPRGSSSTSGKRSLAAGTLKEQAQEQLQAAMAEKAHAEEALQQAKRQRELAEQEFANARRIRQQAVVELEKAQTLKEQSARQLNATVLLITCHSCKHRFQQDATALRRSTLAAAEGSSSINNSVGLDYISAALREWEVKKK